MKPNDGIGATCLMLAVIAAALLALLLAPGEASCDFSPSGLLEIHYINVGQGGCTLIIGPNGTRVLYDFGAKDGGEDIVPYLMDEAGISPGDGIHYTIVSHNDSDHYLGYKGVVKAGYEVLVANYSSGSSKSSTGINRYWMAPAKGTEAGPVRAIPVGLRISLGDGAELIVAAANGRIIGGPPPEKEPRNENDRSVALLIRYRDFQYILDGDLGSGRESCTGHKTGQKSIQPPMARALINEGLITEEDGVDVVHVAHHGSQSSTSAAYFNLVKPEVGLVNVGLDQRKDFMHPRKEVVENVLLEGERSECVSAPELGALFQTEDGLAEGDDTSTSNRGLSVGDITLVTDGKDCYRISGNNRVHDGDMEADPKGYTFLLDEAAKKPTPPRCRLQNRR